MNRGYDTEALEGRGVTNPPNEQALAELKKVAPSMGQGAIGGLISSVCCLLPALAITIGLTGGLAATLVGLGRFRLYGILFGVAFVVIASWFSLRRGRSCCTEEEYKRRRIAIHLTMFAFFVAVYGLIMYIVLPLLYGISS